MVEAEKIKIFGDSDKDMVIYEGVVIRMIWMSFSFSSSDNGDVSGYTYNLFKLQPLIKLQNHSWQATSEISSS